MLTDMILEEEFEKNGEPWYNPQELEHDLHLAAELGKTLLDRNHDLEQALQEMYSTNQEQLQEIEYLTKQVDLLRQMNDQHAKVYEQLDMAARDLEQGNQRLVQDNRLAQYKIHSLTETIEALQTLMEDLQAQVEELKTAEAERNKRELAEQRRSLGAQSVSCLKELYDLHHDRYLAHGSNLVGGLWSPRGSFHDQKTQPNPEEENAALQRSIQTLQSQITAERSRREAAELEMELTTRENSSLEQQLALLTGCQVRQKELEAEVEQLQLLWRADCANRRPDQLLVPDTVFFASEEKPRPEQSEPEEQMETTEAQSRSSRQRCNSDSVVKATNPDEILRGHEQLCIRRAEAVKKRGISLLNEVDAQYSALQVKYDELLQRCQQVSDEFSHKAVQTSSSPLTSSRSRRRRLSSSAALSDLTVAPEDGQQPEYKALFKEIFTCIQKTKDDLSGNGQPLGDGESSE